MVCVVPRLSSFGRQCIYRFVVCFNVHILGVNHLLKSPFCIHPKTGNVAVPLDPTNIRKFDVKKCPRIELVLRFLTIFIEFFSILINELSENMKTDEVKENRKILGSFYLFHLR